MIGRESYHMLAKYKHENQAFMKEFQNYFFSKNI